MPEGSKKKLIRACLASCFPVGLKRDPKLDVAMFLKSMYRMNATIVEEQFPFVRFNLPLVQMLLVEGDKHPLAFDCSSSILCDKNENRWLKVSWKEEGDMDATRFVDACSRWGLEMRLITWNHRDCEILDIDWLKGTHSRILLIKVP